MVTTTNIQKCRCGKPATTVVIPFQLVPTPLDPMNPWDSCQACYEDYQAMVSSVVSSVERMLNRDKRL
jgi:hypothetical protein